MTHARLCHEKAIRNVEICLDGTDTFPPGLSLTRKAFKDIQKAFKDIQLGLRATSFEDPREMADQAARLLALHSSVYAKLRASVYQLRFDCDATEWQRKQLMIFFIRGCKAFAAAMQPLRNFYWTPQMLQRDLSANAMIAELQKPLRQPLRMLTANSTSRVWHAAAWPRQI